MKELLRNKNYFYLMCSDIVNRFGDSIDAIVFAWLAYALTDNASFSVLVYACNRIPTVLLMPFSGAFIEKKKKQKVMIVADLTRGILVGIIVVQRIWHTFYAWELLVVTFLISCVETLRLPASKCMIPLIVEDGEIDQAISYNTSFSTIAELAGTASAAFIIGVAGNEGAMCIDILTFVVSALFLRLLKVKEEQKEHQADLLVEMKEGLSYVKKEKVICYLLLISLFLNGSFVPYNSLEVPFISEVLKGDSAVLSMCGFASGLGMIVGSSLYPKVSQKLSKRSILLFGAGMLTCIYLGGSLSAFIDPDIVRISFFVVLTGFVGIGVGMYSVCTNVLIVSECGTEYLARVSALLSAASQALSPVLALLVSGVVNYISIHSLFLISGIFMVIGDILLFRKKAMPNALQK